MKEFVIAKALPGTLFAFRYLIGPGNAWSPLYRLQTESGKLTQLTIHEHY